MAVDIEFRLKFEYGSRYRNGRAFIKYFPIEVPKCDLGWGFDVWLEARCCPPKKEGIATKPLAAMGSQVTGTITTPKWQKPLSRWRWALYGNGNLEVR